MKEIIAIVTGIIAGMSMWFLGYMIYQSIYPNTLAVSLTNSELIQGQIDQLPNEALYIRLIFDVIAIFTTGLVASLTSKSWRIQAGIIAVAPFFVYIVVSDFTYTYKTWFVVLDISLCFLIAMVGIIFGSKRKVA